MSKAFTAVAVIVVLLLSTSVWAQTAQSVQQCRAENMRAHSEIVKLFQDARAHGRITPAEAQGFANREASLRAHQQTLNRGGLTLPECQRISRELAAERAYVQKIAATPAVDPKVAQCRAENQKAHAEILKMFHEARAAGRITPAEAQGFTARENRLKAHQAALNRGGLTMAECQQIGRELAAEREYVKKIAATPAADPKVAQCRAENQKAHAEILRMFQQARAAGKVTPAEARGFANREHALKNHQAALSRGGLTLQECQRISRELANEREYVKRIAR